MRLSDARLRRRETKLIYPDHRPTPWPSEVVAPRSLEPIVRCALEGPAHHLYYSVLAMRLAPRTWTVRTRHSRSERPIRTGVLANELNGLQWAK